MAIGKKIAKLERMRAGELTGAQILILPLIARFDDPPSLNDLAIESGTSHQNIREILKKLEQRDFVTLFPDKYDYRIMRIALTEKGEKSVDEYYFYLQGPVKNLYEGMEDADIEAACRVVKVLCSRIETLHVEAF